MRLRPVFTFLLLFACIFAGRAQGVSRTDLVTAAIRARGFATVYADVDEDGTLFNLSADEAVSTLFRVDAGLTPGERDAVLLLLLVRSRATPSRRRELVALLEGRIDRIDDWSLVAEVLDEPVGSRWTASTYLELADRILAELRAPSGPRPGYERAAIALARRSVAGSSSAPGSPRADPAGDLALAETLRSIARLSRSREVVTAARAAARYLLASVPGNAN